MLHNMLALVFVAHSLEAYLIQGGTRRRTCQYAATSGTSGISDGNSCIPTCSHSSSSQLGHGTLAESGKTLVAANAIGKLPLIVCL